MSKPHRASTPVTKTLALWLVSLTALAACGPGGSTSDAGTDSSAEASVDAAPAVFAWEALDTADIPGERFGAMVAPVGDGTYYMHGGLVGGLSAASANDTWKVEVRDGSPVFTRVATTNDPPARSRGCMSYDPTARRLLMIGGRVDGFTAADNTTWQLSLATGAWSRVETTVRPPGGIGCSMVWSARDGAALHFGGAYVSEDGGVWSDETWRFDGVTNQWARVMTEGAPSGRYDATMAFGADGRELLLFGGGVGVRSQGRFNADVWRYELEARRWTRLTSSGPAPTARRGHFMLVSRDGQRLLVGVGESATEGLTDVWSYDRGTQRWTEVSVENASAVEPIHTFPSVFAGGMGIAAVLIGGYDDSGFPSSAAWRLRAPASLWQ